MPALVLGTLDVDDHEADPGQDRHGPAQADPDLGPASPLGVVLVAPVGVVLALGNVVGPRRRLPGTVLGAMGTR